MVKELQIAALIFLSSFSLGINSVIDKEPLNLAGTTWNGQYNVYNNYYHFKTKNEGVFEAGILASNCAIDPKKLEEKGISWNHYIYEPKEKFEYIIQDSTLTLWFPNKIIDSTVHQMIFHYRKNYNDWISEHEYAYGFEVLKAGDKIIQMKLE